MAWSAAPALWRASRACFHRASTRPWTPRRQRLPLQAASSDLTKTGGNEPDRRKAPLWQAPLQAYRDALDTNPVLTKALTSCVGFFVGDKIAQSLGGAPFDPFRSLRLSLYGLLLDGPVGHWWYELLDKHICPEDPKSTRAVLLKTAADQLVWAPAMTCVFFAFLKVLEGHPEAIAATIKGKLWATVLANYVLWPLAHYVSFKFVPLKYRILYNNVISIFWNAYLSWTCGGPTHTPPLGGAARPGGLVCHGLGASSAAPVGGSELPGGAAAQLAALDQLLGAWGTAGLPGQPEAALELLANYVDLEAGLLHQACSLPAVHTTPPGF